MYSYVFNRFYQNKFAGNVNKINIEICVFFIIFLKINSHVV